jgi:diguanylate cyclase (GGDEF)-like protein
MSNRTGHKVALMFIDLDWFKSVNDTLGHSKGDILLQQVGHRLVECVRETDTVSRQGGDEFTIVLGDLEDLGIVERIATGILHKLATTYDLNDATAYVSASIGITLYPTDATSIDDLLKGADQAMYESKNLGRNRFNYFKPIMQQAALKRVEIINDLRLAVAEQQFMLLYQPIVDLATGEIHKAEALIRWVHPIRGIISPLDFIPIAEETGMIVAIGEWVFKEAANQAAEWLLCHHSAIQISINKSPVQFRDEQEGMIDWIDYLERLGLKGSSITVEITEGLLLDASSQINNQLLKYRDAGIQVSLDDFGTGYSSLAYLKKFDIDFLKIDQSFVRGIAPNSSDMALCEAIIVMAHKLGMKVIAEGIETQDQHDLLKRAGCDYGQGYLFSRPIPAVEFEKFFQPSIR